jgi:hypothetical protein
MSESWITKIIKLQVFKRDEERVATFFEKVAQIIEQKFENISKVGGLVEVRANEALCQFRVDDRNDILILKSTVIYNHEIELEISIDNDLRFFDISNSTLSSLPLNTLSTFLIFVSTIGDETQSINLVERLSDYLSKQKLGIGRVRGCLFSILESELGERELFNKNYIISPLHNQRESVEKEVESIVSDIENVAVYTARLSKLYSDNRSFFTALKPGAKEISERIENFLWKLTGPEPVELKILESWLAYIMERESTISAMILTMQGNLIEAKSIIFTVEDLFNKLSEGHFQDYPKNLNLEIKTYNRVVKPFEDYIIVSEALKSRLGTVMEEVRTYLSLQQQNITLEVQKASKDQLIRLVNLQEILHKLEIIIIAVYLTEIARIVFEALFSQLADLMTVIFIPISLIISILLIRKLHKNP